MGLAHGVGKVQQNVHRVAKGRRLKDLRADVAVEPLHLQMGPGQGVRHKLGRLAVSMGTPNWQSIRPVLMAWRVWGSIPGVTRSRTRCR